MRLKPVIKRGASQVQMQEEEETIKKERKSSVNTLPPDVYKPMFEPIRFLVRETPSSTDSTKWVRQYLELSVKRSDDGYVNNPMVYVQMYQESEKYTGYLKGKTVYLPLDMLYDLIDNLTELSEECDRRHIQ